ATTYCASVSVVAAPAERTAGQKSSNSSANSFIRTPRKLLKKLVHSEDLKFPVQLRILDAYLKPPCPCHCSRTLRWNRNVRRRHEVSRTHHQRLRIGAPKRQPG